MKKHLLLTSLLLLASVPAVPALAVGMEAADAQASGQPAGLTPEQQADLDRFITKYHMFAEEYQRVVSSIVDKETADAAAPKLKEYFDIMAGVCALLDEWANTEGIADAVAAELDSRYAETMQIPAKIDTALQALQEQEPPYFGSADLMAAISVFVDDGERRQDAELDSEQSAYLRSIVTAQLRTLQGLQSTLAEVKDKETADAAVRPLRMGLEVLRSWDTLLNKWVAENGLADEATAFLEESGMEARLIACYGEILQRIKTLAETDPPFYGSKDLEDALAPFN